MASNPNNLTLLLHRPSEPAFIIKGSKNTVFDIPSHYLNDRYKDIAIELFNRFGEEAKERIPVKNISLPDMSVPRELGKYENFSLFIPKHRRIAGHLINIFIGMRNVEDLTSAAVFAREHCNPYLFNYCLSVALLHRDDCKTVNVPSFITSFPDKFMDGTTLQRAREEVEIVPDGSRQPIEIPRDYTASDLEPEHRLAYFREDLGINLHHWHWHLVYPFNGPDNVVRKDRRGELFYYMHQQIMARYNLERFCNKMPRVERLLDLRQPIKEAYFPKLDSLVSSRGWPARTANQFLQNLNREADQIKVDLDDMDRWRQRIYDAIHQGFVTTSAGQRMSLTETGGIDVLGNILESSSLTPNSNLYGDLHNMGHVFVSLIHDPDGRHLETFGVIGDSATAMRDPIFYRWHATVDDIFQEFKATLPPYTAPQLNYQNIVLTGVQVQSTGGRPNEFGTFWQQSDVDLSRGMDFTPRGSVFARFTHLQHNPFTYTITVNNRSNAQRMGTCRIFLGPKQDERGLPWLLRDQRGLMVELDRFTVTHAPETFLPETFGFCERLRLFTVRQGQNTITRRSDESSVTIPFERSFRNLDANRPTGGDALAQFNFCGCGWPDHMLLPKGTPEGFPCELFVMISNYDDDKVEQTVDGTCNDASSFCGLKDKLYPDRRSMGYPFDRVPRTGADTLQQFLFPNMRVQDVTVRFNERTVQRKQRS